MKKTALIFIGILIVATCLRLYKLGSVPASMYIDEVAIGVDAKSLAQTGHDMHGNSIFSTMFPSYGDYKLPVYIWLAAGSVKLFGATSFAVRLPSAIAGIATVALVFFLVRELFEKEKHRDVIALCSAAVTCFLPWSILFSRTGFEGHVGQAFVLAAALCCVYARKSPRWLVVAAVVGAVGVYTYFSVRFVFPVILVASSILWFQKKQVKRYGIWLGFAMIVFGVLILPLFHSRYYAPSEKLRLSTPNVLSDEKPIFAANQLRDQDHNSLLSRLLYHRELMRVVNLSEHYLDHFDLSYLFLHGDVNLRHSTGEAGLMLLGSLPFFLVGIYVLVRRWPRVAIFLAAWYLVALLPASVPAEVPHALRSLNGVAVLGVVCGVGAYELSLWLLRGKKRTLGRVIFIAICGVLTLNFISFEHDYFQHYNARSHSAWDSKWLALTEFVLPYMQKGVTVHISSDEDKTFLWLLFYGNYDFNKVPSMPADGYILTDLGNVQYKPISKMNLADKNSLFVSTVHELDEQKNLQHWTGAYGDDISYFINP